MTQYDSLYKLHILKSKKSIRLSEVTELTSLAVHPIIVSELDVNSALIKQSESATHFTRQLETSENIVLIRLTDAQTHKAYLEKQIRLGAIKVRHHHSNIPLDANPEDMPTQSMLFEQYVIEQTEFINFANLLSIEVVIDLENDQVIPAIQSKNDRNQEWQRIAEEIAKEYADAKKPILTRNKAAKIISNLPQYKSVTEANILRNIRKTW